MVITPSEKGNTNSSLERLSAWAFFAMPLCYVGMFIIFGVLLDFPQSEAISDKIAYIATQELNLSLAYIIGYLIFGCLLLMSVQATHNRLNAKSSLLLKYASAFGFIWVVLMMCSGMIALVGLNTMIKLYMQGSPHAETLYLVYTTVVNGLGGGVELVGSLWVLLISIHGLKTSLLSKGLSSLGVVVGFIGISTIYQGIPEFKDAFGLLQIVWFVMMGFALIKLKPLSGCDR
jgi:hypothetical protein